MGARDVITEATALLAGVWDSPAEDYESLVRDTLARDGWRPEFAAFVAAAPRLLRLLLAERAWQPIETAPKDGTAIIGFDAARESSQPALNGVEFMRWVDGVWRDPETWTCHPTHWMPLPAPPEVSPHG